MAIATALLRGLRRPGYEPQLTQALAAVLSAQPPLASEFVRLILGTLERDDLAQQVPFELECAAEEVVAEGRLDLRFRALDWDVIVELKIHAGYGSGWFQRYVGALTDARHAYVAAVTRDVPLFGEPPAGYNAKWLGSTRWRALVDGMRRFEFTDALLGAQWPLFLDVLEEEGSMGFTRPDPALFEAYGRTRLALIHMEEFVRAIQIPLLQALRHALGGEDGAAALYWKSGRRLGRTRWGRISVPFRVPASEKAWRVRAGVISWTPPAAFFIQPAPEQRWDRRALPAEARDAADKLVASGFDSKWLTNILALDPASVRSDDLENRVVTWAHARFSDLVSSGLLALPITLLGTPASPDEEAQFREDLV